MAEIERTRERERAPLEENTYERSMRARAEWTQRNLTGPLVVHPEDCEWFQARQGKLPQLDRHSQDLAASVDSGFSQPTDG